MNLSKDSYYNQAFSHIYIEEEIADHFYAKNILDRFTQANVVYIKHYKDIFCRARQNSVRQHNALSLILAKRTGEKIYKGARACQSFDNDHFYYTSNVMNCIYNCEYCYLKGMYNSGYLVVFVNLDDYFAEVRSALGSHPMYLCVSYDTDIVALSGMFPFVHEWISFVKSVNEESKNKLTIEIRTKCANVSFWANLASDDNVIFALTMSPDYVIEHFEKGTSSLSSRIACVNELMSRGFKIRLCFDPMIYFKDYKTHYIEMLNAVRQSIDMAELFDISIGTFRISKDYLKQMRRVMPESQIAQFPYENVNNIYQYPSELSREMENFLLQELKNDISENNIFLWS